MLSTAHCVVPAGLLLLLSPLLLQFIIWLYRALGTPIGIGCCVGGGYSAEPDSFSIGDGCVLEAYSAASNHTSECCMAARDRARFGSWRLPFSKEQWKCQPFSAARAAASRTMFPDTRMCACFLTC